jgi:hypothetical protein
MRQAMELLFRDYANLVAFLVSLLSWCCYMLHAFEMLLLLCYSEIHVVLSPCVISLSDTFKHVGTWKYLYFGVKILHHLQIFI